MQLSSYSVSTPQIRKCPSLEVFNNQVECDMSIFVKNVNLSFFDTCYKMENRFFRFLYSKNQEFVLSETECSYGKKITQLEKSRFVLITNVRDDNFVDTIRKFWNVYTASALIELVPHENCHLEICSLWNCNLKVEYFDQQRKFLKAKRHN